MLLDYQYPVLKINTLQNLAWVCARVYFNEVLDQGDPFFFVILYFGIYDKINSFKSRPGQTFDY